VELYPPLPPGEGWGEGIKIKRPLIRSVLHKSKPVKPA
jgi:hypothetical protein